MLAGAAPLYFVLCPSGAGVLCITALGGLQKGAQTPVLTGAAPFVFCIMPLQGNCIMYYQHLRIFVLALCTPHHYIAEALGTCLVLAEQCSARVICDVRSFCMNAMS